MLDDTFINNRGVMKDISKVHIQTFSDTFMILEEKAAGFNRPK